MRLAIVTAIVGSYEKSCKVIPEQSEDADFFVFTDNLEINTHNIWKIVDINKYRFGINESDMDKSLRNSLYNNQHSFNRAKFIKLNLHRIPELKDYDAVVWLDGTVMIRNVDFVKYCKYQIINNKNFITFDHHERNGILKREVIASHFERYISTYWLNQTQPYQDIDEQYIEYIKKGFEECYFDRIGNKNSKNYGVWVTCFLLVDLRNKDTKYFMDKWWYHNMKYTTQDQISFSFLCWENNINVHSLPNFNENNVIGDSNQNNLFVKLPHGL